MNLGTVAIIGILGVGAVSVFGSSSSTSTLGGVEGATGGFNGTETENLNDNSFLKNLLADFNKPNEYKKINPGYNSTTKPNNALKPRIINNDLAVFENEQNKIVGGLSVSRKQSLTAKSATLEANNINNPIVKISRSSGSSSKKAAKKVIGPSLSSVSTSTSKDATIRSYENKTKSSTSLTKKQVSSYKALTGGF